MSWLTDREVWETASFVVTVFGLPLALVIFLWEQRRERQNDEEQLYQKLSDDYADFLKLVLEHSDLRLGHGPASDEALTEDQRERKEVLFEILVALFERAYILVYEEKMTRQTARLWASWEDYMRYWCARADFRARLPDLLAGEDPEFVACLKKIAEEMATLAKKKDAGNF